MKKILLVSALVLVIATSMVSGTLAVYTKTIGIVASGSVTAKNFIMKGKDTTDYEKKDLYIAPGDISTFTFTVSNSDTATNPATIAEVSMNLDISINLAAGSDMTGAIVPLTVVVTRDNSAFPSTSGEINVATGTGTLKYSDTLTTIAAPGQTNTYIVTITWPKNASNESDDTKYASHKYGTALTVSVTGTQQ